MTIKFYTNPMSRGQIARWALHEAGAAYDEIIVDFGRPMKTPPYRDLNPMGKVPTIVHDGNIVTECAAICLYLADAFPDAGLQPDNLTEKADYYRWTFFATGPVEQAIVNHSMGWEARGPRAQGRLGYGNYELTMGVLSDLMRDRAYVCGDRFTAADIYVGAQVDWGLKFKTVPVKPALEAYAERLRSRPAYLEAKEIDGAHIQKMQEAEAGES
ncbi:MAG: glutathione S-transferase family protein [Pseudomonadota bacterium]